MFPILKKEFYSFFSSATGYLVVGLFLLCNGLALWVLDTEINILNAGFADLNFFFYSTPWFFVLLIPAITMKSFADDYSYGTLEILKTIPLRNWDIVLGKFFAALLLIFTALLPTLTYVYTLYQLGNPVGNIDLGSILGAYIGLCFLAISYTAIGLFTATLTRNQIVSFLLAAFGVVFFFYGGNLLAPFFGEQHYLVTRLGMHAHYKSMGRGVLDTRDILYFISISLFFLALTKQQLSRIRNTKKIGILFLGLVLLNSIGSNYYKRFDLTKDQRYSLSSPTKNILHTLTEPVSITVYLSGDFPAEFKRLQIETQQLLEELQAENSHIFVQFTNPDAHKKTLVKKGMYPSQLTVEENGKISKAIIFPWAEVRYQNKVELVSLLSDNRAKTQEAQLDAAVEDLEYNFATALKNCTRQRKEKIAVLSGNGELDDLYLYSFLKGIGTKYHLGKFTLDAVASAPEKTLEALLNYDLLLIAKPTEAFSEAEKFTLDQFITHSGKTLWMLDNVQAEQDSLAATGKMLAYPRDLQLTNLLFQYGVRIGNSLVKDVQAASIPLATGMLGDKPQFQNFPWYYHPLSTGNPNHVISKNNNPVRLQFANQIDTLQNGIQKTVLLSSSTQSQKIGTPTLISLEEINNNGRNETRHTTPQIFAVLLEGTFRSAYATRMHPFNTALYKESSTANKMVIIADGDIAKNQVHQGEPVALDIDKWTNERFGNSAFLENTIAYLLDDTGLIHVRNKSHHIQGLHKSKIALERGYWQFFNLFLPLFFLGFFGVLFSYFRKKRYTL